MELLGGYFVQKIEELLPVNKDKNAIVFCIDENYVKYFSVVLESFISVSNQTKKYDLVVLYNDLSSDNISKLTSYLPSNIPLRFYNVEKVKKQFIGKNKFKPKEYWSESMYFRLLIPEIFKKYKKVLYCDSDIIFNNNIDGIFNINDEDKSLLVVLDSVAPDLKFNIKRKDFIENYLHIKHSYNYFNSGVILFNLRNINNKKYFNDLIFNLNKFEKLLFPDQDILNVIFQDNVKYISLKWNFQINIHLYQQENLFNYDKSFLDDYFKAKNQPSIIHYAGTEKPWHNPALFLHDKFWQMARKSPFYEEIIYDNYNKKLKLLTYKDDIYRKYLCSKILSKLTFGDIQKKLVKKRNDLKQKVRNIRIFLRGE